MTAKDRQDHRANLANLASVARELLARALTVNGITTGPHNIDITSNQNLRVELTRDEARHLAALLEHGSL